jgi:AI-2 transport protein TqsA
MLALVLNGFENAAIVTLGYVAINMGIGNLLEPRVMGRRLGLSPLVVVLSLIFWSWVWGPVGMLLSLPLTMVVKILMENSEDFRAAAVLLGPVDEE